MLTQKRLREVLHYDPETGIFTWTKGRRKGKIAGTIHDDRGSLKVAIDGERHHLHHLAWLWMTGMMPRWHIAHVDEDPRNNRWKNLSEGAKIRRASHRAPCPEQTNIPGVVQVGDRFEALIATDSVTLNLGAFATAGEARDAIREAIRKAREKQDRRLQAV